MKTSYILLTRLASDEAHPVFSFEEKERTVKSMIAEYCPDVTWTTSYATLGPWNYVDIFEAPDTETAMKVAAIVRYYGGAHTEIWPAIPWEGYKDALHDLNGMHA